MTTDPLVDLVEAFRDHTARSDEDASALRARVLSAFTPARRPRPLRGAPFVSLAAVLIGAGALAANSDLAAPAAALRAWLGEAVRSGRVIPERSGSSPAVTAARPITPEVATPLPLAPRLPRAAAPAVVTLQELDEFSKQSPRSVPAAGTEARRVTAPPEGAASARMPDVEGRRHVVTPGMGPSEELRLYRAAHALHFGGGDPSSALEAFRAYLSAYPAGVLSVEARYNEAVCLARLGRKREAAARFTAFASGALGPHLREEAARMLEALEE